MHAAVHRRGDFGKGTADGLHQVTAGACTHFGFRQRVVKLEAGPSVARTFPRVCRDLAGGTESAGVKDRTIVPIAGFDDKAFMF
jgi:hypothetical protein